MNYKIYSKILVLLFSLFYAKLANSASLQVPRFVTIKANEANARNGPGVSFPVEWIYHKKGIPVEIIAEYEQWRKIRDLSGDEGWIHSSILSGKRSVVVNAKNYKNLYKNSTENAKIIARIHPKTICAVSKCNKLWCKVNCSNYKGWMTRENLWGIYKNEEF